MKNKKFTILIIFVILFFLLTFIFLKTDYRITPEGNTNNYFIKNIVSEDGQFSFSYFEPLNEKYNQKNFAPRSAAYSEYAREVVPLTSPGVLLIFGFITYLFGGYFIFLAILATVGMFYYYKSLRIIFGKSNAKTIILLVSLFPVLVYWLGNLITNIIALDFFFIGLYYLIKQDKIKKPNEFYLSLFFFSLSLLIRYDFIIYCIALFPFLRINYFLKNKQKIIIPIIIFFSVFIVNLYFNLNYLGGILKTGYSLASNTSTIITSVGGMSKLGLALQNIAKYLFGFFGFLTIPGIIIAIKNLRSEKQIIKKYAIFSLVSLILSISLFSWGRFYGIFTNNIDLTQSHLRYYLPIYLIFIPYSLAWIKESFSNRVKIMAFFLIFLTIFSTSLFVLDTSLLTNQVREKSNTDFRSIILNNTEENSIIFTKFNDKFIFPDRKIFNYYGNGLKEKKTRLKEVCIVLNLMVSQKEKIYFIKENFKQSIVKERGYATFEEYAENCKKMNIHFIEIERNIFRAVINEN